MTEEKRIITSEHGALSCDYYPTSDNTPLWHFSAGFTPAPITKTEFKEAFENRMFGIDGQVIRFIGIDEFWDIYSKPITGKKVPDDK